jgi:lysyl-tRNA synthetase class 2
MSENRNLEHQESTSSEAQVRRQKVKELEALGLSPWPAYKAVDATSAELRELALSHSGSESIKPYAFSGRVMATREHGKTAFLTLQDRKGNIQTYFKQDVVGQESFERCLRLVDTGDIIWVSGSLFITKTGEPTIKVLDWQLSSKCLNPLAEKHAGLTDVEQRYRQRYLDLICNRESFDKFQARSKIVQNVRQFLISKDFLEVETPMLHPIPGGAAARPFVTHHNTYDFDLYLRIAPELYLKRLVVGGMERVFEINRNFRNEGISTKHNPEFTMLEFYMAHGDYKDGINLTEELIRSATTVVSKDQKVVFDKQELDFSKPFARLSVKEAVCKFGNINLAELDEQCIDMTLAKHDAGSRKNASYGEKLFAMFEAVAESKIVQPTFVIGYPIEVSPLAKRDPENPEIAARFELFVCGMELSNGFTELNDPFDQADRFRQQAQAKFDGDHEAHLYDADYVHALEYGLPPTVGVGIGVDRLVMLLTNTQSIKDVILFPTLRPKKE